MNFLTLNFLLFLIIFISVFYGLPCRLRKIWLLVASYFFYGISDIRALVVLLFVTLNVWFIGKKVSRTAVNKKKYYIAGIVINISILILFKYLLFIFENIKIVLGIWGITVNFMIPNVLLPIGLSFIIFQAITYLGDIYHEKIAECDIVTVASFIAFFPTILSGPIQKSRNLIPQLDFRRKFEERLFVSGMLCMMWGYFQKIFIADKLESLIGPIFDMPQNYNIRGGGAVTWSGMLFYPDIC